MRLINADALIESLLINPEECPGCPEPEWIEEFIEVIEMAPTATTEELKDQLKRRKYNANAYT